VKQDEKSKDRFNSNKFKIDLMPHHNNMNLNASNNGERLDNMLDVIDFGKIPGFTALDENSRIGYIEANSPFARKIKMNNELSKDKYRFDQSPKNFIDHSGGGFG
jgi:hypothetical protein